MKLNKEESKQRSREKARELLVALISGTADSYQVYRNLYRLWCSHNSAVQELRPLFRIPGVEPDGRLSITEEFKQQTLALSVGILASLEE